MHQQSTALVHLVDANNVTTTLIRSVNSCSDSFKIYKIYTFILSFKYFMLFFLVLSLFAVLTCLSFISGSNTNYLDVYYVFGNR